MKSELESVCHKFGAVQVGYGFECVKRNGKTYTGEIVKVASYARGTLVTIVSYQPDTYRDSHGEWHDGYSPVHKSIYLEDCETWWVYVYNRETVS